MINLIDENQYLYNQNKEIVNKILVELNKLKYNFSYKGTIYLIDTIYILYFTGRL